MRRFALLLAALPLWLSADLQYEFERLYQREPVVAEAQTVAAPPQTQRTLSFTPPLDRTVVSGWTYRDPRLPAHVGVDLGCAPGDPVYAAEAGNVIRYWNQGCGNYLAVRHGNGWISYYCHLSGYGSGGYVDRGDAVGFCGNTGASTGPHLHFEIRHWDIPADPLEKLYSESN